MGMGWKTVNRTCKRVWFLLVAASYLIVFSVPQRTSAFFTDGCIASVAPSSINVASSQTFVVTVTNGGSSAVRWVDIVVPGTNYFYVGNSIDAPWVAADNSNGVTASEGVINSQQSSDFQVTVSSGLQNAGAQAWTVRSSTNTSGTDPVTCTGAPSTSITGTVPQEVNGVSNINVSSITHQSATVTWQSDAATTSLVYYGTTSSYSKSSTHDANHVTDHAVTLTGLSASTTYHFQVIGMDGQGGYAYSMDNTFVTAQTPVTPPAPPSGGTTKPPASTTPTTGTTKTTTTVSRQSGDATPPNLSLATKINSTYRAAPVITGEATDNISVNTIEYSIDGGKNWLPVDSAAGLGTGRASFSFRPNLTDDGNYPVVVRVIDNAGNTATTIAQELVIDTLPPVVGGALTNLGALTVKPDSQGVMHSPVGVDQKITVSAVGGATSIIVDAVLENNDKTAQSFSFTRIPDVGLWTGALNFQNPGTYQLTVRALDGAGNKTERSLGSLVVDPLASVIDAKTKKQLPANITVYYREPETKTWVRWDGSAYSQANPVRTGINGRYVLYLPGGTYYFKVSAAGYSDTVSKIFTLNEPTTVSTSVPMRRKPSPGVGSFRLELPWFNWRQVSVNVSKVSKTSVSPMESKPLPDFSLPQTDGAVVSPDKLYGKPTVVTFVATWSQPAQDQLLVLSSVDRTNINVVAVGSGESQAKLASYQKVAGSSLPILVDGKNSLIGKLSVSNLPTSLFVDRHGVVKKVMVGVLSKKEIMDNVSSGL